MSKHDTDSYGVVDFKADCRAAKTAIESMRRAINVHLSKSGWRYERHERLKMQALSAEFSGELEALDATFNASLDTLNPRFFGYLASRASVDLTRIDFTPLGASIDRSEVEQSVAQFEAPHALRVLNLLGVLRAE